MSIKKKRYWVLMITKDGKDYFEAVGRSLTPDPEHASLYVTQQAAEDGRMQRFGAESQCRIVPMVITYEY